MEYKMINGDCYKFEDEINYLIRDGWVLHGQTQVIFDDKENCFFYFQAMTKIKEAE